MREKGGRGGYQCGGRGGTHALTLLHACLLLLLPACSWCHQDRVLSYYISDDDPTPRGQLILEGCTVCPLKVRNHQDQP